MASFTAFNSLSYSVYVLAIAFSIMLVQTISPKVVHSAQHEPQADGVLIFHILRGSSENQTMKNSGVQ